MIKTFIFDLGKVIVPYEINRGLESFANCCDLSSAEIGGKFFGSDESRLFETGKISTVEFFEAVRRKLYLKMNFEEFADAWNSIFLLEPIIPQDFVRQLAEKYRLIILSDTNELHISFIKKNFSVLRYFDEFVVSYEVGHFKPAKEMFQVAVEKAECLPEECFFTDDKKENIDKAREFGINAVQFVSFDQFEAELRKRQLID